MSAHPLTRTPDLPQSEHMNPSPRLTFPSAPARPGEGPRFDGLRLDPAGTVDRPAIDAPSSDLAPFTKRLIRVLDDDGMATGAWAPALDHDSLVTGLRDMLTVRALDAAMLRAHRQGKASFYMQAFGEEAIGCAHRRALRSDDMTFPTYRQQGLLVAAGYPLVLMMNQVFSNSGDPMKGRQLPVMYSAKDYGYFSISGNLGTQYVQAVGWAMAAAINSDDRIASGWIGEGATAEPDFHSALLFASVYNPPVLLNIVNNQWAISTHESVARGKADTFAHRGLGYGIPGFRVDGNDYLAVHAATQWAAERARRGHGPTLIEWVTYRAGAHSTSDDPNAYRPKDAFREWPLGDPVERLDQHLRVAHGWTVEDGESLRADVDTAVAAAFDEAEANGTVEAGPWPPASTMFDDVFAEPTTHLMTQRREAGL